MNIEKNWLSKRMLREFKLRQKRKNALVKINAVQKGCIVCWKDLWPLSGVFGGCHKAKEQVNSQKRSENQGSKIWRLSIKPYSVPICLILNIKIEIQNERESGLKYRSLLAWQFQCTIYNVDTFILTHAYFYSRAAHWSLRRTAC